MAQMNVSLPDGLKAWAEARVAESRYSSTSDYVRDLIRRDQQDAEATRQIQAAIEQGRAAPFDPRSVEQIFAELRADL